MVLLEGSSRVGQLLPDTYPCRTARLVDKRTNGTVVVGVPAEDAVDLEVGAEVEVRPVLSATGKWPGPFGALAGELSSIEIEDNKAARREALQGTTS